MNSGLSSTLEPIMEDHSELWKTPSRPPCSNNTHIFWCFYQFYGGAEWSNITSIKSPSKRSMAHKFKSRGQSRDQGCFFSDALRIAAWLLLTANVPHKKYMLMWSQEEYVNLLLRLKPCNDITTHQTLHPTHTNRLTTPVLCWGNEQASQETWQLEAIHHQILIRPCQND